MSKIDRRRLNRIFLGALPEALRFHLMRSHVQLDPKWPSPSLEIKIADSEEELANAYRLLHNSYVQAGFMTPHSTGMRILPQHLLPHTTTIVAKWDGRVIGTLSLIRDNPFGLPLEKIFDVSARRRGGRRIAEVSSLAVDPNYRHNINKALFPLFRFVYQYALHFFGTHEFVIAVNPSMVDLYLGFMCFDRLEKATKNYDFVNGAKAVGLFLNFETCQAKWKAAFDHRPEHQNFNHYWTQIPGEPMNRLPERKYLASTDPVITPQLLENFFMEKAELWKTLTMAEVQILSNVYPHPKYQEVFNRLRERYAFRARRNLRMDVQMPVKIGESPAGELLNVSLKGLQIKSNLVLVEGQVLQLHVQIHPTLWTSVQAQILWTAPGLAGAQILTPSLEWLQMIRTLENEYEALVA